MSFESTLWIEHLIFFYWTCATICSFFGSWLALDFALFLTLASLAPTASACCARPISFLPPTMAPDRPWLAVDVVLSCLAPGWLLAPAAASACIAQPVTRWRVSLSLRLHVDCKLALPLPLRGGDDFRIIGGFFCKSYQDAMSLSQDVQRSCSIFLRHAGAGCNAANLAPQITQLAERHAV